MSVRTALKLINDELDAYLTAQEGELDSDTRFCVAWFEQHGMSEKPYGEADVLARAKDTVIDYLVAQGVLYAAKGRVRLLRRDELDPDLKPRAGRRESIWLYTQHLVLALNTAGEDKSAAIAHAIGSDNMEAARALAYRLYTIAERRGWAEEALAYNTLVVSWTVIQDKAAKLASRPAVQLDILSQGGKSRE